MLRFRRNLWGNYEPLRQDRGGDVITLQEFLKKWGTQTASLLIERVCEQAGSSVASNGCRILAEEIRSMLETESRHVHDRKRYVE